jgi:hypothetical protein
MNSLLSHMLVLPQALLTFSSMFIRDKAFAGNKIHEYRKFHTRAGGYPLSN